MGRGRRRQEECFIPVEKALKEHGEGEEKARGVLHSKCKSEKRKVRSLLCIIYFFFFIFA
jgi:hypothetical protein